MQSPLNTGLAYKKEFDTVYKDLAKKYSVPLVPFMVVSVFLNPDLMLQDRIHPNKDGYEKLIDDYVLESVLKNY
jgi:acyl-CoA thioesterase-1